MRTLPFILMLLLLIPAWGQSESYWPPAEGEWERVTPEDAGADEEILNEALDYAGDKHSKAVVVLWRGRILAERYWDGWDKDSTGPAYSASKSLVSTLVGIATDEGKIQGVDQKSADFLEEWRGSTEHEDITIGNHLAMNAGLEGGRRNFLRGIFTRDERAFATGLPVAYEPGTYWEYHNSAYRLLFSVLEEATGQPLDKYTQEKLFDPLGMKDSSWRTKRRSDDFTFLETSARDAARFGLFALRKGNWEGEQLLGESWIDRATKPANPDVNPSYGYLWWLNGGDFFYLPLNEQRQDGPIFPSCPNDAFAALGKDDQKIYVVPSLDLVVTRLGDAADSASPALSHFDDEFLGRICRSFAGEKASEKLAPGTHERTLSVDGEERRYRVYVPETAHSGKPAPAVLAFHGGGGNPDAMVRLSGLNDKADEAGFIVVYPYGTGRLPNRFLTFNGGNCCGYAMQNEIDDVTFVDELLNDLAMAVNVDEDRIYATGISNGAIVTHLVASELSHRIAAIAPVAGPMGTETCNPAHPVPVIHFHGTADEFAPFEGGVGPKSRAATEFYSVGHSLQNWIEANGCDPKPVVEELPDKADDGMTATRKTWGNGRNGSEVVLIQIEGGGHTWPGMEPPVDFLGPSTKDVFANDLMWEFFEKYARTWGAESSR